MTSPCLTLVAVDHITVDLHIQNLCHFWKTPLPSSCRNKQLSFHKTYRTLKAKDQYKRCALEGVLGLSKGRLSLRAKEPQHLPLQC